MPILYHGDKNSKEGDGMKYSYACGDSRVFNGVDAPTIGFEKRSPGEAVEYHDLYFRWHGSTRGTTKKRRERELFENCGCALLLVVRK